MRSKRLGIVEGVSDRYDDPFHIVRYGPGNTDVLNLLPDQFAGSLFPISVGDKVELAYHSPEGSHIGEWRALSRNDEDMEVQYASTS